MARTWILRTDTKGTGAQMVPLETITERSADPEPVFVPRKHEPRPETEEPKTRAPWKFRVVDLMTREVLVDDAGTREAVDALKDVRSIVDVSIYVWAEDDRWRLLPLADQRAIWELAHRQAGD